ncbi:MAG: pilus assembly protein PilO [Microcoleaceae cyanobacterium]
MTQAIDNEFELEKDLDEAEGPSLFGIQFTPKVIGMAIAIAGVLLAAAGIYKAVIPAVQQGNTLSAEIETTQNEIEEQEERLRKKDEAELELATALARRASVTGLFADESTLETLLFDLNEQLNQINASVTEDDEKARITQFEPVENQDGSTTEIINDGSFGSLVNGKLRRRVYEVELEGSFSQTQQFLTTLERLQPLLLVKELNTELNEKNPVLEGKYENGKFVPAAQQPQRRLTTAFELHALLPLSQEQVEAAAAAAETAAEDAEKE